MELALDAATSALALELSDEPDAGSVERTDDHVFLVDAARGLDERERQILFLRYVRDLEPNQVAEELGISRRQLSRNTQAALAKLRRGLEHEATGAKDSVQGNLPAHAAKPKMAAVATSQDVRERQLGQRYHIELVKDDAPEGAWIAQVEELSGCAARGTTPDEAVRHVEHAMREWIAEARAKRREVPRPRSASSHSGRLLVRMPQSLHAELARAAEREEVSLNQFITSSLSSAVGWRRDEDPGGDSSTAPRGSSGNRAAIVANLVVLAVVAAVAVVLLIIALERGF